MAVSGANSLGQGMIFIIQDSQEDKNKENAKEVKIAKTSPHMTSKGEVSHTLWNVSQFMLVLFIGMENSKLVFHVSEYEV